MGTSYKTRITIDDTVKICKYSKFDGYDAEKRIREFFTNCDIDKMKDLVRKVTPTDLDYVKQLTTNAKIGWDYDTDRFHSEDDSRRFFRMFPEFSYSQSIWNLLPMIYNGELDRVPYVDVEEKYMSFIIDVNLDSDKITVCKYHGTPYTLPLQMMYTDDTTTIIKVEGIGYECTACKYKRIRKEFAFCPMCGRKILREVPIPTGWTDDYKEKDYNHSEDDEEPNDEEG